MPQAGAFFYEDAMKPLNFLMFLLGLSLAFVPLSYAATCAPDAPGDGLYIKTNDEIIMTVDTNSGCNWYSGINIYSCYAYSSEYPTEGYSYYHYERWARDEGCEVNNEPGSCTNGVQDGDETGIDCGGSCADSCDTSGCIPPAELTFLWNNSEGNPVYGCMFHEEPDDYGNCPTGYYPNNDGTSCVRGDFANNDSNPIPFNSSDFPTGLPDDPDPPPSGGFTGGTYSTTTTSSSSTSDNGDGTSTTTTTVVVTGSSGASETTTTTETTDNATGNPVGPVTTTTTGETIPEENSENYDFNLGDGSGDFDGSLSASDIPDEQDITSLWQGYVTSNPIATMITGSGIQTSNPQCELTWNYNGTTVYFSFCAEPWPTTLNFMGQLLIFISTISTYFIIFGRD